MPTQFTIAASTCLLASLASAQLGRLNGLRLDVQTAAGALFNGQLGVQVVNGRFFVSGRRDAAANPHKLFEFNSAGTLIANYSQPAATSTSPWGIRDMAYDGQYIWGGLEGNVLHAFDPVTNAYVANTITVGAGPALIRALAYNPNGNGGQGSFWTGNFTSAVYEFSRTGAILRTLPHTFGNIYGAACDPVADTIWWFSQGSGASMPPATPAGGVVWVEMYASGPSVGQATGNMHVGDLTVPGTAPNTRGGIAGGADFYLQGGSTPTLVALVQATNDFLTEQVGSYDVVGCAPGSAALRTGGGAPYSGTPSGNATFRLNMTGLPANISLAQLVIGAPGAIPPLPPLLPCGLGMNPLVFLTTAAPSGGAVQFGLPVPFNAALNQQSIEVGILLVDVGPPLSVPTVKITIVFGA